MSSPVTPHEPSANRPVVISRAARRPTWVRRPPDGRRPPGLGTSKSPEDLRGAVFPPWSEAPAEGPTAVLTDAGAGAGTGLCAGAVACADLPAGTLFLADVPPFWRCCFAAFLASYSALRAARACSRFSFLDPVVGRDSRGGSAGTAACPAWGAPRTQAAATCARAASGDSCHDCCGCPPRWA
ncbi:hypothetical protein [Streptomyces scabiei]|uniref:hypothetical protein n=1 Tax=Streptomyces scabiei TaxID=1930 RepID=UPI001FF4A661|nr:MULTISPECIES: hypothetical protein [unclassified Streptomyces]